jgi:hypothetical protein
MMVPPRRFSLLVAAAALGAAPAPARAAAPRPAAARPAARDLRAAVTAVRVAAGARGGAEVTVHVEAQVDVQHFVLDAPRRVVLDLGGATLMAGAPRYDGAARGGVTNVRAAQYRAGVVRVVVELDGARKYRVDRGADGVQLVVEGGAASFATWHGKSGGAAAASAATAAAAAAAADAPAAQAAAQTASAPAADAALPAAAPTYDPRPRRATRRPPRTAAATAAAAAAASPRRRSVDGAASRGPARLTVTYQDADIRDVIAAFAAFSGRTIIAGRDVTGTVTAEIKDQPWDVALRALLGSQGLAASEDRNGIIVVDSWKNLATTRSVEPMTTQIVTVNYAKASSLLPIVQTLLTRDCGADAQAAAAGRARGAERRAARVRGPRRRHGRLGDQQAARHRRAVAHGRHLRPAQGAGRAHAAGGDQGEDRVRQPHRPRGHRRLVRPRHGQRPVLPEDRPAHRPDHPHAGDQRRRQGGGDGRRRAVLRRPGVGGRQRALGARQRRPRARPVGAQPDLLGDARALPADVVPQRPAADVAGRRAERAEHRHAQQPHGRDLRRPADPDPRHRRERGRRGGAAGAARRSRAPRCGWRRPASGCR